MEERYYDSSSNDISEEDLQEETGSDDSAATRKKSLPVSTLLLAVIGAALVVVVMVTVWFWERPQSQPPAKQMKLLEHRIGQLEDRIARLDGINKRVMALESQGQKFMTAVDRLDRFETAITLRMDIVAKELAGLQQTAAGKSPAKKQPPAGETAKQPASRPPADSTAPAAEEKATFHTVSAGETLYSISRRYGLSVDELLKANKMDNKATIYPGQKLKVR
jgi:LysM repeat protein